MWQGLIIIAIMAVIMLFGAQNMHQTKVNFPFMGTFEARTVFLLLLCFFLGYIAASFTWLIKNFKDRHER